MVWKWLMRGLKGGMRAPDNGTILPGVTQPWAQRVGISCIHTGRFNYFYTRLIRWEAVQWETSPRPPSSVKNPSSSAKPVRGYCLLPGSPLQSEAHFACQVIGAQSGTKGISSGHGQALLNRKGTCTLCSLSVLGIFHQFLSLLWNLTDLIMMPCQGVAADVDMIPSKWSFTVSRNTCLWRSRAHEAPTDLHICDSLRLRAHPWQPTRNVW